MTKEKFVHYIGCRYNYRLYKENPYKIKNRDYWMESRIDKFIKLLVSLDNQTNLNFNFIVFLDDETPEKYKEQISKCLIENLHKVKFELSFISPSGFFKNLNSTSDFLITSRIDNDDEYVSTFVETIQKNFSGVEEVLDVNGIQCDLKTNKKYILHRKTPNSPFISLVSKTINKNSVFDFMHMSANELYNSRFVDEKNYHFIQNIHENNISNRITGNPI